MVVRKIVKVSIRICKYLGLFFLGLFTLFFIGIFTYKFYLKISTRISAPNGISCLEEIRLGGQKQWIFIRGEDQRNPVLLFLHGGPGEPALGMSSSRMLDAELIKHFTVVHWDQLGAGKSYQPEIPSSLMTMDRWVEDCKALIEYLQDRFKVSKIFLVAHSGGTIPGLIVAKQHPEMLYAYIGVSQIINDYEQQMISYNFVLNEARRSENTKAITSIQNIGPPPYSKPVKEFKKARFILKYGGFIHKNVIKGLGFITLSYLTSPEYSFSEGIRTVRGSGRNFTMNARYDKLKEIDFKADTKALRIPVYFIQGKYDMITPTKLLEEFYEQIDSTSYKHLLIFENSAHNPIAEERQLYEEIMINSVLPGCMK